jgi:hypothetical protein
VQLVNQTPFAAGQVVVLDRDGAERLVVAVKTGYVIAEDGALAVAEEQDPLGTADVFHGEPDLSSIRWEAELGPEKPAIDVVLLGSAHPARPGARRVDVQFTVGPVSKRARVFGDRRWERHLGLARLSEPEPFAAIPLTYENAYGGTDRSAKDPRHHAFEARNPVGRGFRAKRTDLPWLDTLAPNVEDPDDPISRPGNRVPPTGFSFLGRHWQPRVAYVGTYDQAWLDERMPLLPLDFDDRFHNAAPPDLVVAAGGLAAGAPVEVVGCTPNGRLAFRLPAERPLATAEFTDGEAPVELRLETVAVDTNRMRLHLLWKGGVPVHRRLLRLKRVACRTVTEA